MRLLELATTGDRIREGMARAGLGPMPPPDPPPDPLPEPAGQPRLPFDCRSDKLTY